jgi:hypothetical protein
MKIIIQSRYSLKEKFLFFYSIFLVILLLATTNNGNSILIYLLIFCCLLLILNPLYLIPVYFISSLANTFFIIGEDLGIGRIIGLILILGGLIYAFKNPQKMNKKNLYYIVFITIFAFISSSFSLTHSFHSFFMFMQYFAIVILLGQFKNVNLNSLTLLLLISSIITILYLAFTLRNNLISIQFERLSANDDVNSNRFAMMLEQLSAVIFASVLIYKKKSLQTFLILVILLSFYMLILSGSRAGTFGILMAILISSILFMKNQFKKYIFPLLLMVILGYVFFNYIQNLNIPFINRFSLYGIESEGGSQERYVTWKTLIPIISNYYPFFGCGFGAENVIYFAKNYGLDKPAHNFLIDMFLQIGIFGSFIFISYFIYIGKSLFKNRNNIFIYVPIVLLIASLFNGVGESIFPEKLFWNDIALGLLYMNNNHFQYPK